MQKMFLKKNWLCTNSLSMKVVFYLRYSWKWCSQSNCKILWWAMSTCGILGSHWRCAYFQITRRDVVKQMFCFGHCQKCSRLRSDHTKSSRSYPDVAVSLKLAEWNEKKKSFHAFLDHSLSKQIHIVRSDCSSC